MPPLQPRTTSIESETTLGGRGEAICVVTPYSTGCSMALEMQERGYQMICLWKHGFSEEMKEHVPVSCRGKLSYVAELEEAPTMEETASSVKKVAKENGADLISVVCGGEAGVELADALSEYMGLLSNGTDVPNRRDKEVQQDLVREAGLRAVRQATGTKLGDVEEFLQTEKYPLIVKPVDSAGSDGVKLCRTYQEAKDHVESLFVKEMVNGGICEEVLCQEFLDGKEYVVDQCSRNGIHKTCMIWQYDKKPANGADFVYYGMIPVPSDSPEAKALIPYARGVLDAIGIKHGPTHGEFIITETGPALVEMNVRMHGKDGYWQKLERSLTGGYNQVDVAADAYVNPDAFMRYPDNPPAPMKAAGQCVDLVSYTSGIVKAWPGYDIIRSLGSYVTMETHIQKGSKITPTVDIATDTGSVVVMNQDTDALERDIAVIRQLENDNAMFEFYDDEELQNPQ